MKTQKFNISKIRQPMAEKRASDRLSAPVEKGADVEVEVGVVGGDSELFADGAADVVVALDLQIFADILTTQTDGG